MGRGLAWLVAGWLLAPVFGAKAVAILSLIFDDFIFCSRIYFEALTMPLSDIFSGRNAQEGSSPTPPAPGEGSFCSLLTVAASVLPGSRRKTDCVNINVARAA